MGKGDRRTKRGKMVRSSRGKSRPSKRVLRRKRMAEIKANKAKK